MKEASGNTLKEVKVVLLGSTTVGKSSILNRFIRREYSTDSVPTIGAAFQSKTLSVDTDEIKLQIWDTGGSERYRSMAPMYFHDAKAAIIVYDITSIESFNDISFWIKSLKDEGDPDVYIALVGNKCDLQEMRKIPIETTKQFCATNNIDYFVESSALTGQSIDDIFQHVAEMLLKGPERVPKKVDIVNQPNSKSGCNC